jgi:NAD(P)-dependent dehydrogenase (short-subunit alcohol dehydrogenase family)
VLVHGRDQQRVDASVAEVGAARGYVADLSSLTEVRRLATEIERDNDRLDVLINNAGIGGGALEEQHREVSADGYELRFAVNYLAAFLLTNLLLPLLRRSAPARIVNVSSAGQAPVDFDDVMLERNYDGAWAYRQSKLAQVTFTVELAERLRTEGETGVTVTALHPESLMNTKMVYEMFGYTQSTIEDGVRGVLRLAVSPELEGVTGRYFDRLTEARAEPQAYDPDARRRLWDLSEELVARVG